MHFPTELKGDVTIFHIEGEIGMYNAPQLKDDLDSLFDKGVRKILINLAEVPFVDSSGIGIMVKAAEAQAKDNGHLVVCNLNEHLKKLLGLTMVGNVLMIYADVDEALEALKKAG